jgi:hypothetical protein
MEARMEGRAIDAALVITVTQSAIDFLWSHWDRSRRNVGPAFSASMFWTTQAFGSHGDWVRVAARDALDMFLRAYLDQGMHVAQCEDNAVATVVFNLTGQRVGAA